MRIQNVNMAVPVGQPTANDAEALDTEISTEMDALRERCVQAIRQRSRFSLSTRQRELRTQQFDVELKGIVKKLASTACSDIADRGIRTDIRVRLYTDLSTIAQAISTEVEATSLRQRRWRKWTRAGFMAAVFTISLGMWLWLGQV